MSSNKHVGTHLAKLQAPESPEFLAWFSGSKVVDPNGEPLVVYHGTSKSVSKFHTTHTRLEGALGAYFTESPEGASGFASEPSGRVYPVFLQVKKPLDVRGLKPTDLPDLFPNLTMPNRILQELEDTYTVAHGLELMNAELHIVSQLKGQGYDGIVFDHETDEGRTWVVFKSDQVWNALANKVMASQLTKPHTTSTLTHGGLAWEKNQSLGRMPPRKSPSGGRSSFPSCALPSSLDQRPLRHSASSSGPGLLETERALQGSPRSARPVLSEVPSSSSALRSRISSCSSSWQGCQWGVRRATSRELDYSPRARHDHKKDLKHMSPKQREQIEKAIALLGSNPRPHNSEELTPLFPHYFKLKIGEYRAVYSFTETAVKIWLIGKRNDNEIYRDLRPMNVPKDPRKLTSSMAFDSFIAPPLRGVVKDVYERNVEAISKKLSREGLSFGCQRACQLWAKVFFRVGVSIELHDGFYQIAKGEEEGHTWLELYDGETHYFFDPTWGQFSEYGPPSEDRYIDVDVEDWDEIESRASFKHTGEFHEPLAFYNDVTNYSHWQLDGTLYAVREQDETLEHPPSVGYVSWTIYQGELSIRFVHVEPEYRRLGIGTQLIQKLREEFPKEKYVPGMKTDLGSPFFKSGPVKETLKKIAELKRKANTTDPYTVWVVARGTLGERSAFFYDVDPEGKVTPSGLMAFTTPSTQYEVIRFAESIGAKRIAPKELEHLRNTGGHRKGSAVSGVVSSLAQKFLSGFGLSRAQDLNEGLCVEFAENLVDQLRGLGIKAEYQHTVWLEEELLGESYEEYDWDVGLPVHAWVKTLRRYYDAEVPEGVRYWWDLPIFKRFFGHNPREYEVFVLRSERPRKLKASDQKWSWWNGDGPWPEYFALFADGRVATVSGFGWHYIALNEMQRSGAITQEEREHAIEVRRDDVPLSSYTLNARLPLSARQETLLRRWQLDLPPDTKLNGYGSTLGSFSFLSFQGHCGAAGGTKKGETGVTGRFYSNTSLRAFKRTGAFLETEAGKPLPLYHGTSVAGFTSFKPGLGGFIYPWGSQDV